MVAQAQAATYRQVRPIPSDIQPGGRHDWQSQTLDSLEDRSSGSFADAGSTLFLPTQGAITAMIAKLRPHELRWLAEDVINVGILACRENETEELREMLVGWIETADLMISTRRRARYILRARQEGRDKFGGEESPV